MYVCVYVTNLLRCVWMAWQASGVDVIKLEKCMDSLFNLNTSSPPMLLQGGTVRSAVKAAFASLLMYYEERLNAGEMRDVNFRIRSVITEEYVCSGAATNSGAHDLIVNWGKTIRSQFQADNLRLTSRPTDSGSDKVAQAISDMAKSLGQSIGLLHSTITNLDHRLQNLERSFQADQRERSQLAGPDEHMSMDDVNKASRKRSREEGGHDLASGHLGLASTSASSANVHPHNIPSASCSAGAGAASVPKDVLPHQPPKPNFYGPLVPMLSTQKPQENVSLYGKRASDLWAEQMAAGGELLYTGQDRHRAALVKTWFDALAIKDESRLFKPASHGGPQQVTEEVKGERKRVLTHLNKLVVEYLKQAYRTCQKQPRDLFKKDHWLLCTSLEDRLNNLKKEHSVSLTCNRTTFQSFRKAFDEGLASSQTIDHGEGI